MSEYEFTVVIEQDEDGVFIATVPALCGRHIHSLPFTVLPDTVPALCGRHTAGDTEEEARELIKDAISLVMGYMLKIGEPIPGDGYTTTAGAPDIASGASL